LARFLITSALPYINGIKHLGNLAGSMLPADVHARFRRLQGHEVLFICATDEHGTPAELAAAEAKMTPRAYCDEQHEIQKRVYAQFRLSFDWFGRSSNPPNHGLTQHFCDRLEDRGLIEERSTPQVYSVTDGRFLPDRYVEGTCPVCGYENARGDQCDNCGSLLDPVRLIKPRSKISGSTDIELRETAHLHLLQSKMAGEIRAWVDRATDWPQLARSIAYKWLDEGLQDRAITRDLSWGIPVTRNGQPRPGFEHKVFYVWFDAPIEYIGATIEWAEATGGDWERWWRTDKGADAATYVEFMGKDNVAFHTVSFPATLLGSQEPWKLVDRLKAFNWVTWYGGKFSTSEKRGVFMDKALELLPSDYWRWRLMANAPETADSAFTWDDFQKGINADLVNVFGNFVNRVTRFCEARFESRVPTAGAPAVREQKLAKDIATRLAELTTHHEEMEFRKAAATTRAIWSIGNEYLQDAAPWSAMTRDPDNAALSVRTGLNLCRLFALIAQPFIPDSAETILQALKVEASSLRWPNAQDAARADWLDCLPRGASMAPPSLLFRKIEDADVTAWAAQFGGAA
jgi:methionyl-tRNA synthetase